MILRIFILCIFLSQSIYSFSQKEEGKLNNYSLEDFFSENNDLDSLVDISFMKLNDKQRVGQMIISSVGELGKPADEVRKLIKEQKIGGVIFLKGKKQDHKDFVNEFNILAKKNEALPLLYSMDAEPSLLGGRIKGSRKVKKTNKIKDTSECITIAEYICEELNEIGIKHNYAPVCDITPDNAAIGNRSFGRNKDTVVEMCIAFIKTTQEQGIVATAKHFPGHGFVKGDTHHKLVYIDGKMKEIDVYKPLIKAGLISIMIAHIAVKNNEEYKTSGMPAT